MRIKITADEEGSSFELMFEPSGMSYDLAPGAVMYADVSDGDPMEMEIVHWNGGISIWPHGPVVTRDGDGKELHQLY